MVKKFFSKIRFPLGIIVWIASSYWFISGGGTYTIPIILEWVPDVLGWNALWIFCGFGFGVGTVAICSIIAGEDLSN